MEREKYPIAGYKSQKKFGDPNYCPSATRHHLKSLRETGEMPNLVYFKSVDEAVALGYTPCHNCWIKGKEASYRWYKYLLVCQRLGIKPIESKLFNKEKRFKPGLGGY